MDIRADLVWAIMNKAACYTHSHTGLGVDMCFHFNNGAQMLRSGTARSYGKRTFIRIAKESFKVATSFQDSSALRMARFFVYLFYF